MKKNKIEAGNNFIIFYSTKSLLLNIAQISSLLSSSSPIDVHSHLLNQLENGWFAEIQINGFKYVLNDFIGTYRVYFSRKQRKWSQNFWELFSGEWDDKMIEEVSTRGYTTGENTVSKNIFKLLPASLLNLDNYEQIINTKGIFRISNADRFKFDYYYDYENNKNKRVGIAFSGGLDSTFISSEFIKKGIKPTLFCIDNEIDSERYVVIKQAVAISQKLKLDLQIITITRQEIESSLWTYIKEYPNDFSLGFVVIKIFLKKIPSDIDIMLSGQNSDTFLAFGLSRPYHLVETLTRILYRFQYKKIYLNDSLNFIDKLLLNVTYKLRGVDPRLIPQDKKELLIGLANEKFYLSLFNKNDFRASNLKFYDGLEYYDAIILNKLVNHISGNHSLVWSDCQNPRVLLPFGSIYFMRSCFYYYTDIWYLLNPKKILENELLFRFSRNKVNILLRLLNYYKNITTAEQSNVNTKIFYKKNIKKL